MAPDFAVLVAAIAVPFLGAGLTPFVSRALGERTAYYAAALALASLALVASQYGTHGAVSVPWIPAYDIAFRLYVDGLALLIAFLASGVGVLIFTYSKGYMHGEERLGSYYATLLAFMGSMLGIAFAADLVLLFVFWELTSVTSFLLIGFHRERTASRQAARKAAIVTVGGGLFLLAAIVLLRVGTGSTNLVWLLSNGDAVRATLESQGLLVPIILLLAVGVAAKSAQVPLQFWLPDAMEAPTPVSAFLHSATMVKAGVYLVGRFRPVLLTEDWTLVFATLGLLTMTVTAVLAVRATDIKELLAYSTASHLGLIIAGFGFSSALGAETGAFHILNHAVFKAALFLVAGIVAHEAGTRAFDSLGGLRHELPITAGITTVAALGMAGIPPFNGFYSKELLFETTYEFAAHDGGLAWVAPVVAVVGSIFTFLYSIRFLSLFFGEKPDELQDLHRPPMTMLAPPLALAGIAAFIGIFPQSAIDAIAGPAFDSAAIDGHGFSVSLPTAIKPAVVMSAVTILLGSMLYPFSSQIRAGIDAICTGPARADWWYEHVVYGSEPASERVTAAVQNGLLRTAATWILATTSVLALAGYAGALHSVPAIETAGLEVPLMVVLGLAVVAAVAVVRAPSHVAGVLTLSILGFMVAVFYVLASGPDLALTQLVVETLVLVLFLLVLDQLPAFYGDLDRLTASRDVVLSLLVGTTVFLTVLLSTSNSPNEGIAAEFVERSVPEGGGGNIVNVILVDFRGIDTLGEISVIAMAAVSILTLIGMRERGEAQ